MVPPIVSERIRNLWINKINGKYERTSQRSKRESNQIEWIRVWQILDLAISDIAYLHDGAKKTNNCDGTTPHIHYIRQHNWQRQDERGRLNSCVLPSGPRALAFEEQWSPGNKAVRRDSLGAVACVRLRRLSRLLCWRVLSLGRGILTPGVRRHTLQVNGCSSCFPVNDLDKLQYKCGCSSCLHISCSFSCISCLDKIFVWNFLKIKVSKT